MIKISAKLLLLMTKAAVALGCVSGQAKALENPVPSQHSAQEFRIVTWNVEHLASPSNLGCKPRTPQQVAALQAYAQKLDADIVALQEVASEQAVRLLFSASEWQVVMSQRPDSEPFTCRESGRTSTQQKVAFAIRKGIEISNIQAVSALGLDMPGLRHGLSVDAVTPKGQMRLLNVHLKSGCFVDDYESKDSEACNIFTQQMPPVQDWIIEQQQQATAFMILGDFNHRLSVSGNRMANDIRRIQAATDSSLKIATATLVSCHPRYPDPIDHILVGNLAMRGAEVMSHYYDDMREEAMLSDHCAVSISLK